MTDVIEITSKRPKVKISDYDRGYITAEAYAALDVLWSGTASMESLNGFVETYYGKDIADQVFPVNEVPYGA